MKEANVRIEFEPDGLLKITSKRSLTPLRRVGAYVRKSARNAVSKSKESSTPGTPPNTKRGLLKRSILFGVEKQRLAVVIGPAESLIGISMTAHEFGGIYRRRKYPKRPLMRPTLLKTAPQLPKLWQLCVRTHNCHNVE